MPTTILGDNEDGHDGIPWWVKAIAFIGVPSAIACYLVWILAGDIRVVQSDVKESLNSHTTQTSELINKVQETNNKQEQLRNILQRICVNTARTTQERNECFR